MNKRNASKASRAIYEMYLIDGGATATIEGTQPTSGFCVAPNKATEERVYSTFFSEERLAQYMEEHEEELLLSSNHVGIWEDLGIVYLDIVKVVENKDVALRVARMGEQLAIFSLNTWETIRV